MKRRRGPWVPREPLTNDEAAALVAACETTVERLVVFTLLDTGLRVRELAQLTRADVDTQRHTARVNGKGRRRRTVPLSPRSRALVEAHFSLYERWKWGPRRMEQLVKGVAARARITRLCTPHILRHTFATLALQRGVSLPAVRALLGHARLETTAIYTNLSPEEALREYRERTDR